MRKLLTLLGVIVVIVVVAACDGGSEGGGGGTPCEQLQASLCAKLRACPEAPGSNECSYREGTSRRGITCSACEINFSRDICGDTTKTNAFFTACLAAVDAGKTTCAAEDGDTALGLPAECAGFLTCGAGPCKD